MRGRRRRSDRSGRAPLFSPGRPVVAGRDEQRRFWAAIAAGTASEDAALQAGMSQAVGTRLFRKAGGMPPAMFRPSTKPLSDRYLSLRSGRRLHFFECRAVPEGRLRAGSDEPLQRSRGSSGATLRPEVAAWRIARRRRSGMPSDLLAVPSRRSWHSTRHCEPMWRNDWQGSSRPRVGLLFLARLCAGRPSAWTTKTSAVGKRLEPGADCSPPSGRLPGR